MKNMFAKLLPVLFMGILFSSCSDGIAKRYQTNMEEGVRLSIDARDSASGIWDSAGWWKSANILTALVRYAEVTGDTAAVSPSVRDLFKKAKRYEVRNQDGSLAYWYDSYMNDYYDDEGWWALAWIDAYKVFGVPEYLETAKKIFEDMTTGWDDCFGGGLYWKRNPLEYKNSIANNLFALTSVRLYRQTGDEVYLSWFKKEVEWYLSSGLYNKDRQIIEDGLDKDGIPNRDGHYTYNQGVAIAVFTEMYLLTEDEEYLEYASALADSAIMKEYVDSDGILTEKRPDIAEGYDGVQFKGIFIRHLSFLYKVSRNEVYKSFILRNADSILEKNYDPDTKSFGCHWAGPFVGNGAAANSSALECIIEAYDISR